MKPWGGPRDRLTGSRSYPVRPSWFSWRHIILTFTSALEFAPEFAYNRAQELPPLKRTLIRIIRLYFLHDIAHLSSQAEADALVEFFAGCQLPSSFPQLFGPKIVARPGDLSPGEYGMIVKILPIRYMPQSKEGEPEKQRSDRWMNLAGIWQCWCKIALDCVPMNLTHSLVTGCPETALHRPKNCSLSPLVSWRPCSLTCSPAAVLIAAQNNR